MAKTLKEAALTTRNARASLPAGLYWRGIDPDVHLGYRKGKRGGAWLVRWRLGPGYRQERIGTADDGVREGTLDFRAAVNAARQSVEAARLEAAASAAGPVLTVRSAVEAYIAGRDERESKRKGRPVRSDAAHRLERYVLGKIARGKRAAIESTPLADEALHKLDEDKLLAWREGLPAKLKRTTQQRLINDLKAALNAAYSAHRKRLPTNFAAVAKHGLAALPTTENIEQIARENQILSDAKVSKVIAAARMIDETDKWEGDLFRLIVVMAATGARFSQAARMRVADVQVESARLMMPPSRKGRGSKQGATPIPVGTDVLKALLPAYADRPPEAWLLTRWRSTRTEGIRWERSERGPWATPSELVRTWARIRQEADLGADVVPYALRHSSVVRGIRAGLPIRLVAALHDTSVVMIERHYGRWIADGLEDLAARAIVPLV